jgi:hypothetical protein
LMAASGHQAEAATTDDSSITIGIQYIWLLIKTLGTTPNGK